MKALRWHILVTLVFLTPGVPGSAQAIRGNIDLTRMQSYTVHRISSSDPKGANTDSVSVSPGGSYTVMDVDGPGQISHIWFTIADREIYYTKRIVMRMYWDDETTPSVEVPIGDFFGQNTGDDVEFESAVISIGKSHGFNSFFPMPFRKHARIVITNEGKMRIDNLFFNIDYRTGPDEAPSDALYFHAQYRQATPLHGWTNDFYSNHDPRVERKENLLGEGNYTFVEAKGRGQFVGVTLGVLQNQDGWWGEGDDMFFVDSPDKPNIRGTGAEDYFLGGWGFHGQFGYQTYGAPLYPGPGVAGARTVVYRFHLDAPITFQKTFKATMEHGNANHRSDNYYSVAYWYQTEPHAPFPPLPPVEQRLPALMMVGGPGNGPQQNLGPPPLF